MFYDDYTQSYGSDLKKEFKRKWLVSEGKVVFIKNDSISSSGPIGHYPDDVQVAYRRWLAQLILKEATDD